MYVNKQYNLFIYYFLFLLLFKIIIIKKGNDPITNVEEMTKNETSLPIWIYKTLKYTIKNSLVILWYSLKVI